MHYDVKISGARIRIHDSWIRKRVCYPLHHSASQRTCATARPALVRKVFITYICPTLEFNSTIWSPAKKYRIDKLEKIQRRFTKRVHSLSHLSYLDDLNLTLFDLIQCYKVLNNLTCIEPNSYFHLHYRPTVVTFIP